MLDFMGVREEEASEPASESPPSWLLSSPSSKLCDKPLEDLTDEDVMQLTREDCRKYLKDKGMRRPSWNKAQAVQQVLSLRSLYRRSDPSSVNRDPVNTSTNRDSVTTTESMRLNQRPTSSQMTVFYAGTVAVFNDVPLEKAHAIMLLATSWSPTAGDLVKFPQARNASLQRFLHRRRERLLREEEEENSLTEQSHPLRR